MDKNTRIEKLRALKEDMEATLKALKEQKKAKLVQESKSDLEKLFEGELERAGIIFNAKEMCDKLQKMAEDLAKMQADAMPIADNMKGVFGPDVSDQFEQATKEQLEATLNAVRSAKDAINTHVLRMEGKISDEDVNTPSNDMADATDAATGSQEGDGEAAAPAGDDESELDSLLGDEGGDEKADAEAEGDTGEGDESLDDLLGGDEAASGPSDEPLGRAKKESVETAGKMIAEGEDESDDDESEEEESDEAIEEATDKGNAGKATVATAKTGQYKGQAMSTDAGKHKANANKETSSAKAGSHPLKTSPKNKATPLAQMKGIKEAEELTMAKAVEQVAKLLKSGKKPHEAFKAVIADKDGKVKKGFKTSEVADAVFKKYPELKKKKVDESVVVEFANSNAMAAASHIRDEKISAAVRQVIDWLENHLPLKSADGSHIPRFDAQGAVGGIILRALRGEDYDATMDQLETNLEHADDAAGAKQVYRTMMKVAGRLEDMKAESFDVKKNSDVVVEFNEDGEDFPYDRPHWLVSVSFSGEHLYQKDALQHQLEMIAASRGGSPYMGSSTPSTGEFGWSFAFEAGDANTDGFIHLVQTKLAGFNPEVTFDEEDITYPAEESAVVQMAGQYLESIKESTDEAKFARIATKLEEAIAANPTKAEAWLKGKLMEYGGAFGNDPYDRWLASQADAHMADPEGDQKDELITDFSFEKFLGWGDVGHIVQQGGKVVPKSYVMSDLKSMLSEPKVVYPYNARSEDDAEEVEWYETAVDAACLELVDDVIAKLAEMGVSVDVNEDVMTEWDVEDDTWADRQEAAKEQSAELIRVYLSQQDGSLSGEDMVMDILGMLEDKGLPMSEEEIEAMVFAAFPNAFQAGYVPEGYDANEKKNSLNEFASFGISQEDAHAIWAESDAVAKKELAHRIISTSQQPDAVKTFAIRTIELANPKDIDTWAKDNVIQTEDAQQDAVQAAAQIVSKMQSDPKMKMKLDQEVKKQAQQLQRNQNQPNQQNQQGQDGDDTEDGNGPEMGQNGQPKPNQGQNRQFGQSAVKPMSGQQPAALKTAADKLNKAIKTGGLNL